MGFLSKHKKSRWWLIAGVVVVLACIVFALYYEGRIGPNQSAKRAGYAVTNINEIKLALGQYYAVHQSYPKTGGECVLADAVTHELIDAGFLPKSFATQLAEGYPVDVGVSSDALNYVLRSEGSGFKNSPVLATDTDGSMLGCNCDDPNYCVTN